MQFEIFFPAFVIGLLGAGHCLGMCGGISAALAFAVPQASSFYKIIILLAYNLGRVSSYVIAGLVAGIIGEAVGPLFSELTPLPVLRILSAFMLVLMGLYVSGWWKVLAGLERIGARLWKYIQPVSQKLFPIKNPWLAVLVGALWGWLPCGLVYSTLVFALAQGNAMVSAWVMFAFGLGTMPAVLLGGMASEKIKSLMQSYSLRTMMGISLIGFGFWILYFAIQHSGHQHHHASVSPSMAKIPVLAVTN